MKCLNCDSELIQGKGKREKIFCNSTCRSNYWQKSKRLENEGLSSEEIIFKIKKSNKIKETKLVDATIQAKGNNKDTNMKKVAVNMPDGLTWQQQLEWNRNN